MLSLESSTRILNKSEGQMHVPVIELKVIIFITERDPFPYENAHMQHLMCNLELNCLHMDFKLINNLINNISCHRKYNSLYNYYKQN